MASLLMFLLLLATFTSSSSSPSKLSYADHCGSFVPLPSSASLSYFPDSATSININNGYFSGGDDIFAPASIHSFPAYFYFYSNAVYRTKTDGLLRLEASLSFEGPAGAPKRRHGHPNYAGHTKSVRFGKMSGFWSKSDGKVCLVGSGSTTSSEKGTANEDLFAVFKLNYPSTLNISARVVAGTAEILDASDVSPKHLDTITVLGYTENGYRYSHIPTSRDCCSQAKNVPMELLGFETEDAPRYLQSLSYGVFGLEFNTDININLEMFQPFMTLSQVYCSEGGKVHLYVAFSNSSKNYNTLLIPGSALVGEGYWDSEKKRLCLVACPVLEEMDLSTGSHVGECSIGLAFWFPAVITIRDRNLVAGSMWSIKDEGDPRYFSPVSFRSFGSGMFPGSLPGLKYEYTELDSVKSSCQDSAASTLGTDSYPDGSSMADLRFDISVRNVDVGSMGSVMTGYAVPLSFGDNFFSSSFPDRLPSDNYLVDKNHSLSQALWNVSYSICYSSYNSTTGTSADVSISAEGVYNAATGTFCLVGCRGQDPMDCEIVIDVQLSPLNAVGIDVTGTKRLNGTIRSTREESDHLFFEPLEIFSRTMYNSEAIESERRMGVEIIMVLVSLTLSCIFTFLQLVHVKKHRDVLPSISITMLVILTLGSMIPLVLNFEASFSRHLSKQNVLMWSGGWLELNEVIVRAMTMVTFLLQFRLLQLVWAARCSAEERTGLWIGERKALRFCMPIYLAGAFIAWFVHVNTRSYDLEEKNVSVWGVLMSYVGLILDGYLLPQITLNLIWNSTDEALAPLFYVGTTAIRSLPHIYDAYRARYYVPISNSYIYAGPYGDFYSSAWDIIIPLGGVFFAIIVFLQQRFGGSCFLHHGFRKPGGYTSVPVIRA